MVLSSVLSFAFLLVWCMKTMQHGYFNHSTKLTVILRKCGESPESCTERNHVYVSTKGGSFPSFCFESVHQYSILYSIENNMLIVHVNSRSLSWRPLGFRDGCTPKIRVWIEMALKGFFFSFFFFKLWGCWLKHSSCVCVCVYCMSAPLFIIWICKTSQKWFCVLSQLITYLPLCVLSSNLWKMFGYLNQIKKGWEDVKKKKDFWGHAKILKQSPSHGILNYSSQPFKSFQILYLLFYLLTRYSLIIVGHLSQTCN